MTTTCDICGFEYPESECTVIRDPNGNSFIVACESCADDAREKEESEAVEQNEIEDDKRH